MKVADMHCDTLLLCASDDNYSLRTNNGHISLDKLIKGDVLCQCFAIFIPTHECADELDMPLGPSGLSPYDFVKHLHGVYQREISKNSDIAAPALSVSDILKNEKNGLVSSMLTIEDGVFVEGDINRLKEVYDMGVRMITLTWNYENSIGYPNSEDNDAHMKGLKPFGLSCIEEMNRLGIIIDVSHLSEGGFFDVAARSKKPFVASHSCARALCDESRNLTDRQLKVIGETGSVAGVNFYSAFLNKDGIYTYTDDIVRHAVYMADKAGIESIGLGSDFDGIECELEMKDASGYNTLVDAMSKKFNDDQLDKIFHGNVLRVMKENFGC